MRAAIGASSAGRRVVPIPGATSRSPRPLHASQYGGKVARRDADGHSQVPPHWPLCRFCAAATAAADTFLCGLFSETAPHPQRINRFLHARLCSRASRHRSAAAAGGGCSPFRAQHGAKQTRRDETSPQRAGELRVSLEAREGPAALPASRRLQTGAADGVCDCEPRRDASVPVTR